MLSDDLKIIETLIPTARALTKGSMDPLFDAILDGEALLKDERTLMQGKRDAVATAVREDLQRQITRRTPDPEA